MQEKNKKIRDKAIKLITNMEYNYSFECSELLKIIMDLIKENEKLTTQQEGFIKSLLTETKF